MMKKKAKKKFSGERKSQRFFFLFLFTYYEKNVQISSLSDVIINFQETSFKFASKKNITFFKRNQQKKSASNREKQNNQSFKKRNASKKKKNEKNRTKNLHFAKKEKKRKDGRFFLQFLWFYPSWSLVIISKYFFGWKKKTGQQPPKKKNTKPNKQTNKQTISAVSATKKNISRHFFKNSVETWSHPKKMKRLCFLVVFKQKKNKEEYFFSFLEENTVVKWSSFEKKSELQVLIKCFRFGSSHTFLEEPEKENNLPPQNHRKDF